MALDGGGNPTPVYPTRDMQSGLLLLERLSDADLELLARIAAGRLERTAPAARPRADPDRIEGLLARPEVFAALFEDAGDDPLVVAGPFLAFAVLLAHAPVLLEGLAYVHEPVGRRQRVPVFEVEPLREFVDDPLRRLFLADLLGSYTHVASGALWVKSRRGWRHRRFSELDPAQFAELILSVPPEQRLALYRRLGDLTLFLCGVFPDHVEERALSPVAVERLRRAVAGGEPATTLPPGSGSTAAGLGGAAFLEWLGQRAYRLAWEATGSSEFGMAGVLGDVTGRFRQARLILNVLTDRYLFGRRERWFAA